jgi:hypothetical protein
LPSLQKSLLCKWDEKKAVKLLSVARNEGQIFTGAFMINSPGGKPKLEAICERVSNVWNDLESLNRFFKKGHSLEEAHKRLTQYPGIGGFMAYEIVCDLRYTKWLEKACDVDTWCNPGPGAVRGIMRLLNLEFTKGNNATSPTKPKDFNEQMVKLLKKARKKLEGMPDIEMREIEHSLCEFDKYERARNGDGRMKRLYKGCK